MQMRKEIGVVLAVVFGMGLALWAWSMLGGKRSEVLPTYASQTKSVYEDPLHGFSFSYPPHWILDSDADRNHFTFFDVATKTDSLPVLEGSVVRGEKGEILKQYFIYTKEEAVKEEIFSGDDLLGITNTGLIRFNGASGPATEVSEGAVSGRPSFSGTRTVRMYNNDGYGATGVAWWTLITVNQNTYAYFESFDPNILAQVVGSVAYQR